MIADCEKCKFLPDCSLRARIMSKFLNTKIIGCSDFGAIDEEGKIIEEEEEYEGNE